MRGSAHIGVAARLAVLGACGVFALTGLACGESDDGSDAASSAGTATSGEDVAAADGSSAANGDSPEQQVRDTVDRMLTSLKEKDGAAACALMTDSLRRRTVADVEESGVLDYLEDSVGDAGSSCATIYDTLLKADRVVEDLDPQIRSIEVDGDTATATAKVTHDVDTIQRAEFVRQNGEWKVRVWFISPNERTGS